MPKNNSKARRNWRKLRAEVFRRDLTPEERMLLAIFGNDDLGKMASDDAKPGVEH